MKIIKNLERKGAFWKQNSFGYTLDVNEAGRFTNEEANQICGNANIFGTVYDIALEEDEVKNSPNEPFEKRNINDVAKDLKTEIDSTHNPITFISEHLMNNHYYPDNFGLNIEKHAKEMEVGEVLNGNISLKFQKEILSFNIYKETSEKYKISLDHMNPEPTKKKSKKMKP